MGQVTEKLKKVLLNRLLNNDFELKQTLNMIIWLFFNTSKAKTILLIGKNSITWKAIYLYCTFYNVRLIHIDPDKPYELINAVLQENADFVFKDKNILLEAHYLKKFIGDKLIEYEEEDGIMVHTFKICNSTLCRIFINLIDLPTEIEGNIVFLESIIPDNVTDWYTETLYYKNPVLQILFPLYRESCINSYPLPGGIVISDNAAISSVSNLISWDISSKFKSMFLTHNGLKKRIKDKILEHYNYPKKIISIDKITSENVVDLIMRKLPLVAIDDNKMQVIDLHKNLNTTLREYIHNILLSTGYVDSTIFATSENLIEIVVCLNCNACSNHFEYQKDLRNYFKDLKHRINLRLPNDNQIFIMHLSPFNV
jgi:hypothetical protein